MSVELQRDRANPIFKPNPDHPWEKRGTFNPCVVYDGAIVHMLYRGIEDPSKEVWGNSYNPSVIVYASSRDGLNFDKSDRPFLTPNISNGEVGLEDARMVRFDDDISSGYHIFYSVVTKLSGDKAKVEIGATRTWDFINSTNRQIVNIKRNPWDKIQDKILHRGAFLSKGATYFPLMVNGRRAFIFTQRAESPDSTIMYAEIKDERDLFTGKFHSEKLLVPSKGVSRGPEVGAPPLRIKKGWLLIYSQEARERVWRIGAALLDLNDPTHILGKLDYPLLSPEEPYETDGNVPNVVFPSGALITGDDLKVYYGAADRVVCMAEINLATLLKEL